MKVVLFTSQPPRGYATPVTQALSEFTGATDAFFFTEGLFLGTYTRERPLVIDVQDAESVDKLSVLCAECGITCRVEGV
jgi:hypothetical protein